MLRVASQGSCELAETALSIVAQECGFGVSAEMDTNHH